MRRHYEEYVEREDFTYRLQPVAGVPNFPEMAAYTWLDLKQRASGVTANIGEAIGALLARAHLNCDRLGDVVHLTTKSEYSKWKSPDYVVRLGQAALPSLIEDLGATPAGVTTPPWWPMESKARNKTADIAAVRQAFVQLAAYWWEAAAADQGYGLVVNCLYKPLRNQPNRRLDVHVFVPRPGGLISADLSNRKSNGQTYRQFIKLLTTPGNGQLGQLAGLLHG